jgi:L-gulonate 5-dehydrogenase
MELQDVAEPGAPGPGEVVVRPGAVGLCGSDYHFFAGDLTEEAGGGLFPRIQGHEVGAVVESVGAGVEGLEPGQIVAVYPLRACGHCYPCRIDRPNRCVNFELVGVHVDGGLQDLLRLPARQVVPIDVGSTALASLAEPVSIATRAVRRARVLEGEKVVVLGGGPIGAAVALCSLDRAAEVLVVDPLESRLELSRTLGARTLPWTTAEAVEEAAHEWTDGEGPPVVVDATGVPAAVRAAVDMVVAAGRVVIVGMSAAEVSLRVGSFTEKELDVLGSAICGHGEFEGAVSVVERYADRLGGLISHEFPLERAPEAIEFAIANPTDVMKVVIGDGE